MFLVVDDDDDDEKKSISSIYIMDKFIGFNKITQIILAYYL